MTTAAPGLRLGPYELIARIGAGGMGEVWRATDTRLDRSVAIKICHVQFSERFEREARAVAALNHPNICTLYDVGPDYLVMELVEGPTLAERIATGPLPLEEALAIARQITEALEAAHEKGIVHRDLKPANVKLTANGNVKVLDFGLAKALDNGITPADPNTSPTLTLSATRAGMILGTAAYMSPEQARGIAADKRADIWAFGVVLYEMLAGKRMFASESVSDTLASVLKTDPDWSALPAGTPATIRKLLRRCMERDRKRRLHDIADARLEIDEALSAPPESPAAPAQPHSRIFTLLPWSIAALVSIAWLAISLSRPDSPEHPSFQVQLQPPEKGAFTPIQSNTGGFAVSPDGRNLAFVATREGRTLLWVRQFDSLEARPFAGTDNAFFPFWSPDNRYIAFFAEGKLKKVDLAGGSPQVICEGIGIGRGGTWNREGVIVFGGNGELNSVPSVGGSPVRIGPVQPAYSQYWPSFLPDGRHFLYASRSTLDKISIRVGSLDKKGGADQDMELLNAPSNGVYAPLLGAGIQSRNAVWLLSLQDNTLFARRFSAERFKLEGDAVPVASGVGYTAAILLAHMSVSENGVLVYGHEAGQNRRLVWIERDGRVTPVNAAPAGYLMPRLSPDGGKLAVSVAAQSSRSNIWLIDLLRGTPARLTFDASTDSFPLWSPDGKTIAFDSSPGGIPNLFVKPANGSGNQERIMPPSAGLWQALYDWSRDGRYILYLKLGAKTGPDLWIFDLQERKSVPFLDTQATESQGQFSPDGRWVAYSSDASGRYEIYVRSFTGAAQFQVSNGGGAQARWRGDGKEIYYANAGKMMAVSVDTTGDTFRSEAPRVLFEARALIGVNGSGPQGYLYDVTRDGKRFLVIERGDAEAQPLTLVTNWQAGLKK